MPNVIQPQAKIRRANLAITWIWFILGITVIPLGWTKAIQPTTEIKMIFLFEPQLYCFSAIFDSYGRFRTKDIVLTSR